MIPCRRPAGASNLLAMAMRAFPVIYARDVERAARFWQRVGFQRFFQFPGNGPAGYVGLRRDGAELAVVAAEWPKEQYGADLGDGPRFEMFVYVSDVDEFVATLSAEGVPILRAPADMPWGERIAMVADPDGNPVALASER